MNPPAGATASLYASLPSRPRRCDAFGSVDSARPTGAETGLETGTVAVAELGSLASGHSVAAALASSGIPASVEALPGARALVVVPFQHHREADDILRELAVAPIPRFDVGSPARSPALALVQGGLEDVVEDDEPLVEPPHPDPGPLAWRITMVLLAIGFGVLVQRAAELGLGARAPIDLFAASLHSGEAWRFVTAGFIHFGVGHALSNAIFGTVIAVVLFGTHRPGAVALTWLLASALGILAETTATSSLALVAGASAGNYGLVGLWAKGQLDRARIVPMPVRERLRTLGILAVLAPGALTPVTQAGARVAVLAHAAGFVVGFLCGYFFLRRVKEEGFWRIERRAKLGGVLSAAVVLFAFSAALWSHLAA